MSFHFSRRGVFASFWRAYRFVSVTIVSITESPNSWLKKFCGDGLLGTLNFIPCWLLNSSISKSSSWSDHSIVSLAFESLSLSSSSTSLSSSSTSISDPSETAALLSSSELPNMSWNYSGLITKGSAIFLAHRNGKQNLAAPHPTQEHKSHAQLGGFDWSISFITIRERCRTTKPSLGTGWTGNNSHILLAAFGRFRNSKPFPVGCFWPLQ